ncbi:ATP-binding protein [Chitinimonas sp. BJB300]|uniref:ATP-binding protein n=1 Tax=Chitinimonas sp. BJB300 TaxID=1559339 RepID=UPI000C0DC71D|nr:ATP-binding protein [Chitinimonas sp. BJB300]PHV11222.1 two-component sensor histidine kinase [Chitinimonas sp. BJB300]TSJ87381.1 two-component sensor histidine kinase [Chitinimonas sp. BJB300]
MITRSLRHRLIVLLLAVLAPTSLILALVAYQHSVREVDTLFDHQLEQVAATFFLLDLSQLQIAIDAPGFQHFDDDDAFVAQLWSAEGNVLMRNEFSPQIPFNPHPPRMQTLELEHENWRVFRVQEPVSGRWLAVARPLHERDALVAGLAAGLVLPWLMSLLLLVGLIWWAVGRGLAPLTELSQQIASRRPDDLMPVAVDATPLEAAVLVSEINLLLTRVTGALENERRFTADAAHELRTPLAAIRAQVEVAAAESDAEIRQHALRQAEKGVARATRLTEQLLTLARLDHLDAVPDTGECDLVALAREELTDVTGRALAAGVDIALEGGDGLVHGSAELLCLALRNLIDNALAHTPTGGCVTVSVTRDTTGVCLQVQDSGEGLPAAELSRLGERFFRAGSRRPGSGLGLSIVRRIVVLHGGSLVFHTKPGLCAQLRFPPHD